MIFFLTSGVVNGMTCPSTAAWGPACGMRITTTASETCFVLNIPCRPSCPLSLSTFPLDGRCDKVLSEMKARVHGQPFIWHDPHNNGTYTEQNYGGTFSTSRLTGNKLYTDKQIFTLAATTSGCMIEACSRSQVRLPALLNGCAS